MPLPTGRDLSETLERLTFSVRGSNRERLDRYLLRKLGWSSRTKIQKLISLDRVTVNDRPGKAAMKVGRGDEVVVRLVLEAANFEEHPPLPPPLWEDPYLFAVAKPAGQLVHPTGKTLTGTVIDAIHARYAANNERSARPVVARLCHRLDRDTSGLLLVAKTLPMRQAMQAEFEADRVRKGYVAIVEGVPNQPTFEVDAGIVDHIDRSKPHSNRLARVDESGRTALTRFEVLGGTDEWSIVHCRPQTGRQNQIRAHLASVGSPILGDTGYGSDPSALPEETPPATRALLHSHQLRFRHPVWGAERELRCPVAEDFLPFFAAADLDPEVIPGTPPLPPLPADRPVR